MPLKRNLIGLGLVSGGLDSLIACKLVQLQNIEVIGLNFKSPFCICNKNYSNSECGLNLFYNKLGMKIYTLPKEDDYLEVVRNPQYGHGKNMNPCIDCRIYILKKANLFRKQVNADFIFTGEVLNQRPKSQTYKALKIVERESDLENKLLRPLSARLLKPTIWEENGLIDRNQLKSINGRSRKIQLELAKKYGLLENYHACGGCLLTDKNFSMRMRDYLKYNSKSNMDDIILLKYGRHFRFNESKIIIGRNEMENKMLLQLKKKNDIIMEVRNVLGPIAIIQAGTNAEVLKFAAELTLRYSDFKGKEGNVSFGKNKSELNDFLTVRLRNDEYLKSFII